MTSPHSPFYMHRVGTVHQLKGGVGWLKARGKPILPICHWPNPDESKEKQLDFYRRLLFVFKPWRNEEEFSGNECDTLDMFREYIENANPITQQVISSYV